MPLPPSVTPVASRALRTMALIAVLCGGLAAQNFTAITTGPLVSDGGRSGGLAWIDYDGDGRLDLYVANGNLNPQANFLYRNLGGGDFQRITATPPVTDAAPSIGSTWGDVDNDGDPDLFVVNRQNAANAFYRNDGGGSFTAIGDGPIPLDRSSSNGAAWVDLDTDGDLDLFLINFNAVNRLYRNDGAGVFTEIDTGRIVTEVTPSINGAWSDVDDDGDMDLFICNGGNQDNLLYRNGGNLHFVAETLPSATSSLGCAWGDFDNDGDMDLYVANFLGQNNQLYANSGAPDYRLTPVSGVPPVQDGSSTVGTAWADLDNDGDLDLFLGNAQGEANRLYRNEGGSFSEWTVPGLTTDPGNTFAVSAADPDGDGDLDLMTANILDEDNRFYRNEGTPHHWIAIRLRGVVSNRDAIGARVSVRATLGDGPRWQHREMRSQNGYNAQGGPYLHIGLEAAAVIDSLVVRWPSGQVDRHAGLAADRLITVTEGDGVTAIGREAGTAQRFRLYPAAPNPFNPATRMRFDLDRGERVTLAVYDITGRRIATLVDGYRPAGRHTVRWSGRDDGGRAVASGTYLMRLRVGDGLQIRRVTLVR